jgi:hypothetical protein
MKTKRDMKKLREGVYNLADANSTLSHSAIAEHYDICQQTVTRWLHQRPLGACGTDRLDLKTRQEILASGIASLPPVKTPAPESFVGKKCRLLYKDSLLAGKVTLAWGKSDKEEHPYFFPELPYFPWKVEDLLNDPEMKLEVDE